MGGRTELSFRVAIAAHTLLIASVIFRNCANVQVKKQKLQFKILRCLRLESSLTFSIFLIHSITKDANVNT